MKKFKKLLKRNGEISKLQVLILALVGLFAVLVLLQMQQVWQMRDRLEVIDSLGDNNTKVIEEMGLAKNFLMSFGSDLNEIREFLLLPTYDYNFGDLGDVELGDVEQASGLTVQVFDFLSSLADYQTNVERYEANLASIKEYFAGDSWAAKSLSVEGFRVYDDKHANMELLNLTLALDGTFEVEAYDGLMEIDGAGSAENVIASLNDYFGQIEELRALIDVVNANRLHLTGEVFIGADFLAMLAEKKITISEENEEDGSYYWNLLNGDLTVVARILVSKMNGELGILANGVRKEFSMEALNGIDARTSLQILVDDKVVELKNLIEDEGFKAALSKSNFSVGEVLDNEERFSFEILDGEGVVLRILYLDKSTGEVNVSVPEVGKVEDLASAINTLQAYGKKKLWT